MASDAQKLPTEQVVSVESSTEQESAHETQVSAPEQPTPKTTQHPDESLPTRQMSTHGPTTVKIPNVTQREADSISFSPSSQQTTAHNSPQSAQDAFVPKQMSPRQRTDTFGIKASPKIQQISRTFTTGVSTLGGHKLWEHNHNHEEGETQWGVNWYMPSHMAFLGIVRSSSYSTCQILLTNLLLGGSCWSNWSPFLQPKST
jgi:hypothetical protein